MKKTTLLIVIVLLVIIAFSAVGCKNKGSSVIKVDETGLLPPQSNLSIKSWVIFDQNSTQEELRSLAARMYKNACELDQALAYRRMDVVCVVEASGTATLQYLKIVKNGEEYYRSELQKPDDGMSDLLKLFIKPYCRLDYATISANKAIRLESENDVSIDDQRNPSCDLGNVKKSEIDFPYFNASQEPKYEQTDFLVNYDTILNVSIAHNDDYGYYKLEFDIDVNNEEAIAKPYANLSGEVSNAKYNKVHEVVEIWDSGYFRTYFSFDNWEGKRAILNVKSVIDYRTYFDYQEQNCVIDECYGIEKLREEIDE